MPPRKVLGTRALNRATLHRQLLLDRVDQPARHVIEHLVGLQAQAPFPPYFGLWSRITAFHPDELADALLDRTAVRIALMRGTVHLVTAADALALRHLIQPVLDRDLRTNQLHTRQLSGMDLAELATHARRLLDTQPRSARELGTLLQQRWPDRAPASLAYAARNLLPLVQVPPRAVWGRSGHTRHTTAQSWLATTPPTPTDPADLVLRYLRAFGPATINDMQTWSGLTRLRDVVEPLRPRLRVHADEHGRELFDLPDTPHPDPDQPAAPRFIAPFDNLLLSHADRTRVMSDEHRTRLTTRNAVFPGTILIDGFLAGTWAIEHTRHTATLTIDPFHRLTTADHTGLATEGAALLEFAAPHPTDRQVQIKKPATE